MEREQDARPAATVYVLVINDRHADTEVRLFTYPDRAVRELHELAADMAWVVNDAPLEPWLATCQNERESDNAHVVAVEIEL